MEPQDCVCGKKPSANYAERQGEGEDQDENLIATHCFEAWVCCKSCGRHTELMNIECWSEERPLDEPLEGSDAIAAFRGAIELWNRQIAKRGGPP